jgi:RHS repeat-associated protein
MKKLARILVALVALPVAAQTGIPPFGSFQSAGFDTVNLQNLNDVFSTPIVSVPGRGSNFNFAISFNSLLWQERAGTPNTWQPVVDASGNPTWGWQKDIYGGVVLFSKITQTIKCFDGNGGFFFGTRTTWSGYRYRDVLGTNHYFSIKFVSDCIGDTVSGSADSTDGSGYHVNTTDWDHPIAISPGGFQTPTGGSYTDPNGNLISKVVVNSSENDWTDTVGHTVLKVISGTNSIQYKFQDTTGTYQTATLNLSPYTIKTFFQCSNVQDYTSTSTVNLPTSLMLPNGKQYLFTYEQTPGSGSGYTTGRMQQVTLPTGGYYSYSYPGANDGINCADGTNLNFTRTVNDGTNSAVWQFARTGTSPYYATDTVTAPTLPYDTTGNQMVVNFNISGQEVNRKFYQGSSATGTLLRTINTTWGCVGPCSRVTILEDGSTQAEVDTNYDSYGNLLSKTDYDWGTGAKGSKVRTTTLTYLGGTAYTQKNIVNRVTSIKVQDGSGAYKFRQDVAYDESGYINTSCPTGAAQHDDSGHGCSFTTRGNPTTVTTYKDPTTPANGVAKHSYYDWFGNLVKADLNCCQQKTWNYSSATQFAYPDSIVSGSNSPQLTQSFTYNAYTGQVASATDENNQVTHFTYDSMKRPTTVTRPDNAQITNSYDDTARTITTATPITASSSVRKIVYADGLERGIKTVDADSTGTSYSITETQYDPVGRAYKTSNPHNSTAQYWTETDFDAVGRVVKTILPDGKQTTFAYATNTGTVTDSTGKQRKAMVDGLGRLLSVYEPDITNNNSLTQQTSYSYNVLDELLGVSQGVQTRTYGYDNLGRLTSVATPETAGTAYQYQYNDFDLLTQRTDPRGVITTYTYDSLNRPYQVSYNVSHSTGVPATPTVTYTYGTSYAQNNNGRLITMADGVGSENYTYDILGRITQLQKVISGTTYTTSYAYNLASEPASITYPSNRVVQQTYDAIGRLCAIAATSTSCTSYTTPYATGFTYNTAFETTGFNHGNGVTASFGYSPDRLQMTSLSYVKGTTTLFSLAYGYAQNGGDNGEITSITDNVDNGRSVAYTYDPLSRLSTAVTTGSTGYAKWGLSWAYDRYGNRLQQNVTAGSAPSPQTPTDTATNRITGDTYDANGNLTVEPLTPANNYTYDGENHMVNFASGSASAAYSCDGNGLRVKKVSGSTTTVYVFSGSKVIAEYANGSLSKEYVYSGSKLLATIANGVTTYHHSDHLSVRLSTNSSGTKVGDQGHYPFGESWYATNTTTKWQFTSYERDAESGDDYAEARSYINRTGRFSGMDRVGGARANPQSLNEFSYVRNGSVNSVDPSGLLAIPACVWDNSCSGGPDGGWAPVNGGFGLEACGVDPFCIGNGGIGPFGSPVAHICGSDVCSWLNATYEVGGNYDIKTPTENLILNCVGTFSVAECTWDSTSKYFVLNSDHPGYINPFGIEPTDWMEVINQLSQMAGPAEKIIGVGAVAGPLAGAASEVVAPVVDYCAGFPKGCIAMGLAGAELGHFIYDGFNMEESNNPPLPGDFGHTENNHEGTASSGESGESGTTGGGPEPPK